MSPPLLSHLNRVKEFLSTIVRNNTGIFLASNAFTLITRLLSSIILTRILEPSAFGTVAVITTVQLTLLLISDVGFYPFVVRSEHYSDKKFLDEVWTLRLIRCGLMSVIMFFLSGPIAALLHEPDIKLALQVTSISPLLEGFSAMSFATGARDGKVARLSLLDMTTNAFQVALTIGLCAALKNFWGIVIASICVVSIKTVLSYTLFPNSARKWSFSKTRLREVWNFGRYVIPSSMMTLMISQLDKIVLAPLLGSTQFGFYSLASNIGSAPNNVTIIYSSRILFPAFSEAQSKRPNNWSDTYYSIGVKARMGLMAAFGGLIALPGTITIILYDQRYLDVAYYLQIFAISSLLTATLTIANDALVASGHVKTTLHINSVRLLILLAFGSGLFIWGGPKMIAWAPALSLAVAQIYASISLSRVNLFNFKKELNYLFALIFGYMSGLLIMVSFSYTNFR